MTENKLQLSVSYEEDGKLKKKNYTHTIATEATQSALLTLTDALAIILEEDVKGFFIHKAQLGSGN